MYFAIEPSSGVEISADAALTGLIYRCPTCGARVRLRRGTERADHFSHLQWAAEPDCENYTPSRFEYRRRPPGEERIFGPSVRTSYLSFSLLNDEPRLAYWLPPAPDANWAGTVEFEAFETSRAFQASNLRNGQRVEFQLVDGQWEVRDKGNVTDEYLELLARGRQSLDAAGSIFDAATAEGRQILPGQSVTYGQTLHWVSRVVLDPQARGVRLCAVEKLCLAYGWHVYQVQLPEGADTGDELMELVQWLERKIRPARPKVWIESPWPRSTTASGFPVYDPADGELEILSDRLVDIRIADARTGQDVVVKASRQSLTIPDLPSGVYDMYVNDVPHETFVVEVGSDTNATAILVRLDDQAPIALAYAQPAFKVLITSGRLSIPLLLSWGHPVVGSVVNLNGKAINQEGVAEAAILMSPGMRLDAACLGALVWADDDLIVTRPIRPFPVQLRERAAWLLSVASSSKCGSNERVTVPDSLRDDALFRRLAAASWHTELAPQVRAISKSLSEWR